MSNQTIQPLYQLSQEQVSLIKQLASSNYKDILESFLDNVVAPIEAKARTGPIPEKEYGIIQFSDIVKEALRKYSQEPKVSKLVKEKPQPELKSNLTKRRNIV